jgi:3-hydroxybutyryl-CoA dehydrogenase
MHDQSPLPADPDRTPTVVGIVGAGTMGAGIAQVALEAGERVLIHDPDPDALARTRPRIGEGLTRRYRRRIAHSAGSAGHSVDEALGRLEEVSDLETLARASDVVIEAALEDLAVKQAIFARLDALAGQAVILATNTSALSIAAIAEPVQHRERVIGLHFFNPAPLMPLVEVVAPRSAAQALVDEATMMVRRWGKSPVRTADTPGFIVNRVNRPFTLEALALLEAGDGTVDTIDAAIRADGFPMGPFELMDLVGIDINLAAARGIFEGFSYEPRFKPSAIQERLVEAGRFGRKTGEGFYWYGEDGRSLGVAGAFAAEPGPKGDLTAEPRALPSGDSTGASSEGQRAIVERIVLAIVNEAYWALGDGVASVADIDLALRLGASHPSGPFERTAALGGPAAVLGRLESWQSAGPRFTPAPSLIEAARSPG